MSGTPSSQLSSHEEIPLRYRVVHRVDPTSLSALEAYEALNVRRLLSDAEATLLSLHAEPGAATEVERARTTGLITGLGLWVQTIRRHPTWNASIALEARDYLWTAGHDLHPDEPWTVALERFLRLTGHGHQAVPLKAGMRVALLPTPADHPEKTLADHTARVLAALSAQSTQWTVASDSRVGADFVRIQETGAAVHRTRLMPIGDPTLATRRDRALSYAQESLEAALGWSDPSGVELPDFDAFTADQLARQTDLWML